MTSIISLLGIASALLSQPATEAGRSAQDRPAAAASGTAGPAISIKELPQDMPAKVRDLKCQIIFPQKQSVYYILSYIGFIRFASYSLNKLSQNDIPQV